MKETGHSRYTLMQRWRDYRPSKKATFFFMVGAVIATTSYGFSSGAWVSSSKASQMARIEARDARTELAGGWCVQRFLAQADATERLGELQGMRSRFQRTQFIESGDWALMPGESRPNRRISSYCGDVLTSWELDETMVEEGDGLQQVHTDET